MTLEEEGAYRRLMDLRMAAHRPSERHGATGEAVPHHGGPQSLPPYDPYLLRPLGGDLYAVVHEWDLTEIERRRDGREGDRVTESQLALLADTRCDSHERVSRKLPRSNGGGIARNAWPMDTSRHHMVTV